MKLLYGIGINDKTRTTMKNGKPCKEYQLWSVMIKRCEHDRISDNFKSYSYFYDWCQDQVGFNKKGFVLDAKILSDSGFFHSENTCCFVPAAIQKQLKTTNNKHGLPTGVTYAIGNRDNPIKYRAMIIKNGKHHHIGHYLDLEEAVTAYKKAKSLYLAELAEEYKDVIDNRAYEALKKPL